MNWNAFHHRGEILRDVIEVADQRLDGTLPLDVPGVRGVLRRRHRPRRRAPAEVARPPDRDHRTCPGRPSRWTSSPRWPEPGRRPPEQLPGLRLVIDHATDAPVTEAMAEATQRAQRAERARLAQAAALAFDASDGAVEVGGRIEQQARAGLEPNAEPTARPVAEPVSSLLPSPLPSSMTARRSYAGSRRCSPPDVAVDRPHQLTSPRPPVAAPPSAALPPTRPGAPSCPLVRRCVRCSARVCEMSGSVRPGATMPGDQPTDTGTRDRCPGDRRSSGRACRRAHHRRR